MNAKEYATIHNIPLFQASAILTRSMTKRVLDKDIRYATVNGKQHTIVSLEYCIDCMRLQTKTSVFYGNVLPVWSNTLQFTTQA